MNVGFIGMGNMGQMLVTALVRSSILQPEKIHVSNRSPEKLRRLSHVMPGLQVAYSNIELAQRCQVLFCCIRPVDTKALLDEIAPYITPNHLLVTITNTIDIPAFERVIRARVAKVIPSVVNALHDGIALLIYGERCTLEDRALLHRLLGAISYPSVVTEQQSRVASDLTSCGPAFFSYLFRSLVHAARYYQPDLSTEAIETMIRKTALATCRLIEQTGYSFDDVIDKVSTPGGITSEGIKVLEEQMAGVWEQVIETTITKEEAKRAKVEL